MRQYLPFGSTLFVISNLQDSIHYLIDILNEKTTTLSIAVLSGWTPIRPDVFVGHDLNSNCFQKLSADNTRSHLNVCILK